MVFYRLRKNSTSSYRRQYTLGVTLNYFWEGAAMKIPEKFKSRFVSGARPNAISQIHTQTIPAHHIMYTCSLTVNSLVNSQRASNVTAAWISRSFSVSRVLNKYIYENILLYDKAMARGRPECLYNVRKTSESGRPEPDIIRVAKLTFTLWKFEIIYTVHTRARARAHTHTHTYIYISSPCLWFYYYKMFMKNCCHVNELPPYKLAYV